LPASPQPREPESRPAAVDEAIQRLKLAELYLSGGLREKAREILEELISSHPESAEGKAAASLLREITGHGVKRTSSP